MGKNKYC